MWEPGSQGTGGITIKDGEVWLNEIGRKILHHGGHDDVPDDEMLILLVAKAAPGMPVEEFQGACLAIMEQYGDDAIHAVKSGHVQFERKQ